MGSCINSAEFLIISISCQQLRGFIQQLKTFDLSDKILVLCMKGLENSSGKRLSQIVMEELGMDVKVAVWLGPGHVQDFVSGIPNCMVIGSADIETTKAVINCFNSDLIRFYYGQDMIGNEIGAAAKNVIGLAAGMLDGLGYNSLKGALMARGVREIAQLIKVMGGNEMTAYGLTHLGDYEATLFSGHSQNRRYGEALIKGEQYQKLAEGVATLDALLLLSSKYGIELPICQAVDQIINNHTSAQVVLEELLLRPLRFEF